jgi:hypothetical protein
LKLEGDCDVFNHLKLEAAARGRAERSKQRGERWRDLKTEKCFRAG